MFFTKPISCIASTNKKVDFTIKNTRMLIICTKWKVNILFEATRGKQLRNHINGLAPVINPGIVESYNVAVLQ